ncbi:MAG: 2-hydroxyacyl-CoA dehydratase [Victivallales bacterium]|jgi:benzoyl-CoA reductase/2-hydroxyglutaryl-CoA dehydratase subunit BcrC/BadD/HgdB|nr:2-hydroxyacyl-CoA dehydratase [Verrucomicrobiota bacterium]MBT7303517.1 2-hydroxyacyl-CoA dehydratase [Victivallales bacterium]
MHSQSQLSLAEWDERYAELKRLGLQEPSYGGPISRHVAEGDLRLRRLKYDPSWAALNLWNFLLTEEDRLRTARQRGSKIVGTMKDLGTIPVMAYSLPNLVAFYPDGAWWIPCVMELSAGLLKVADDLGIDDSFCPVRAMLGAFVTEAHFPRPDLLVCSVGAVCDDFSAIAQRLPGLGHAVHWWEIPHRREPDKDEKAVALPGGAEAPSAQVDFVRGELEGVRTQLETLAESTLDDTALSAGIAMANRIRRSLRELRHLVFTAPSSPLPALELLVAEMLAIHFCSDRRETLRVLQDLLTEVRSRIESQEDEPDDGRIRVFWVNPVADLRAMNLFEACGGRLAGTDFLFAHALDEIPEDLAPLDALARTALADPMVGSGQQRAERICRDAQTFGAEAVLISRIPGASHCALESSLIADTVSRELDLPVVEIEVPPLCDAMLPTLQTRMEALVEVARARRKP